MFTEPSLHQNFIPDLMNIKGGIPYLLNIKGGNVVAFIRAHQRRRGMGKMKICLSDGYVESHNKICLSEGKEFCPISVSSCMSS